jgi:hypothetical protein
MHVDWSTRSKRGAHVPISYLEIEPLRVEVAASPAFGVGVLGMAGVNHDFKEPEIAVRPADVLGWPGASAVDACGNARVRIERKPTFEFDQVLLAIAEVVLIDEFVWFPMSEIE